MKTPDEEYLTGWISEKEIFDTQWGKLTGKKWVLKEVGRLKALSISARIDRRKSRHKGKSKVAIVIPIFKRRRF